jgi:hypothetical protein
MCLELSGCAGLRVPAIAAPGAPEDGLLEPAREGVSQRKDGVARPDLPIAGQPPRPGHRR